MSTGPENGVHHYMDLLSLILKKSRVELEAVPRKMMRRNRDRPITRNEMTELNASECIRDKFVHGLKEQLLIFVKKSSSDAVKFKHVCSL